MQVIIRNMPDELHRRLKVMAAQKSKTMQDLLIEIANRALATQEPRDKEVGI